LENPLKKRSTESWFQIFVSYIHNLSEILGSLTRDTIFLSLFLSFVLAKGNYILLLYINYGRAEHYDFYASLKGFCHFSSLCFYKNLLLMVSQFIFDAFPWALVTAHVVKTRSLLEAKKFSGLEDSYNESKGKFIIVAMCRF
jgi:hypothetical protein